MNDFTMGQRVKFEVRNYTTDETTTIFALWLGESRNEIVLALDEENWRTMQIMGPRPTGGILRMGLRQMKTTAFHAA